MICCDSNGFYMTYFNVEIVGSMPAFYRLEWNHPCTLSWFWTLVLHVQCVQLFYAIEERNNDLERGSLFFSVWKWYKWVCFCFLGGSASGGIHPPPITVSLAHCNFPSDWVPHELFASSCLGINSKLTVLSLQFIGVT